MITEKNNIKNMIYEIRGKQVMLDSDLAKLYQCKNGAKTINQAVNRHIKRFPERFMFQLTINEINYLWSQFGTANINTKSRSLPYVFTEQGVAMLATILRTDVAESISIQIMDAFVAMRHYISSGLVIGNIEYKLLDHDKRISMLENTFNSFKEKNNHIFFEGQIYDAYSKIIDIFNTAKGNITIIDNYLDKNMLDVISKCKIEVTLITADKLDNLDLVKYKKQYNNLNIIINKSYHDRFIIIDNKILYHLGASLNSIGKKCFAITKIEDKDILNKLIERGINDNRKRN